MTYDELNVILKKDLTALHDHTLGAPSILQHALLMTQMQIAQELHQANVDRREREAIEAAKQAEAAEALATSTT
jgi:hypothetical protein